MTIYLKGAFRWRNAEDSLLSFKAAVVLEALTGESSQAELCRRYNLSENQVSTWKHQLLENVETFFESPEKHSSELADRIAQPEHCLLYTSPSPRDRQKSRMPSSA